jgi:hypothetical protein
MGDVLVEEFVAAPDLPAEGDVEAHQPPGCRDDGLPHADFLLDHHATWRESPDAGAISTAEVERRWSL